MAKKQPRIKKPASKTVVTRIPHSLSIYLRDNTDWDKFRQVLTDMAFGGIKQQNYNGHIITTVPNLGALSMLAEYSYGKPKDSVELSVNTTDTATKLAEIIESDMQPKQVA